MGEDYYNEGDLNLVQPCWTLFPVGCGVENCGGDEDFENTNAMVFIRALGMQPSKHRSLRISTINPS